MHLPSITSAYLALLALLYTVLAVQVGRLRQRDRAAFGDNGSLQLRSAIRAHANFIEYVPIITLMVAMLEMSGLAAMWVHLLMGALLVSRLLHPLGMYAAPNTLQFRDRPGRRHHHHAGFAAGLRPDDPVHAPYRRRVPPPSHWKITIFYAISLNFDTVKIFLDGCRPLP